MTKKEVDRWVCCFIKKCPDRNNLAGPWKRTWDLVFHGQGLPSGPKLGVPIVSLRTQQLNEKGEIKNTSCQRPEQPTFMQEMNKFPFVCCALFFTKLVTLFWMVQTLEYGMWKPWKQRLSADWRRFQIKREVSALWLRVDCVPLSGRENQEAILESVH